MAKPKVFADGQPLTAADINTYLTPDVPKEGLPVNTQRLPISYAAGYGPGGQGVITAEREGKTLYLTGGAAKDASARYVSGAYEVVGTFDLAQLGINPAQIPTTLYGPAGGQGGHGCTFQLLSSGSLRLAWNGGGAQGVTGPQWIAVSGVSIRLVDEA